MAADLNGRAAFEDAHLSRGPRGEGSGLIVCLEREDGRPNGRQTRHRRCGMTSWVGEYGLRYSLLEDVCLG